MLTHSNKACVFLTVDGEARHMHKSKLMNIIRDKSIKNETALLRLMGRLVGSQLRLVRSQAEEGLKN